MNNLQQITTFDRVGPGKYSVSICIDDLEERETITYVSGRFEETGKQTGRLKCWPTHDQTKSLITNLRDAFKDHKVCDMEVRIKENQNGVGIDYIINAAACTSDQSKLVNDLDLPADKIDEYRAMYTNMINQVENASYKTILNEILLNNSDFMEWPAAKSMHHAYIGGLATHSLNVCNNAINMCNMYTGMYDCNINYDLVITGALLHDIGKLQEFEKTGDYTVIGNYLGHMILGIEKINKVCAKNNIDPDSDEIIKLKHIIASHHGTKELGSPVTPFIVEAYIVSNADNTDAKLEAVLESYQKQESGVVPKFNISGLSSKVFKE